MTTLFPPEDVPDAPAEPVDDTLSVRELNQAISEAVSSSFPGEVWVRGEIQQIRRSQLGHAYFELVEKDGNRDNVRARVSVALFKNDRASVNRTLRATPGVKITDGVEVRIRGRVEFYPPQGRLQLVMTGIDPVFTVGKLAADRDRVLRTLAAEGILRRNAAHELPLVPLRVGLVTSGGSAAYHDFVHGLEESGHAFRVALADLRVQGAARGGASCTRSAPWRPVTSTSSCSCGAAAPGPTSPRSTPRAWRARSPRCRCLC